MDQTVAEPTLARNIDPSIVSSHITLSLAVNGDFLIVPSKSIHLLAQFSFCTLLMLCVARFDLQQHTNTRVVRKQNTFCSVYANNKSAAETAADMRNTWNSSL